MRYQRTWSGRRRALSLVAAGALAAGAAHGAAVTVREPAFGLPHIFADTDLELARENGRQIARDRLGQLILLGRVGRGTLSQAFGLLDPGTIDDDVETRLEGYTSSELNRMFQVLPASERDLVLEYCKGVNDTIEAIYSGALPEPIEVTLLRDLLDLGDDLFGNKENLSDQVDPFYAPPGGDWPTAGFQYTPEIAISIGILQTRNFGNEGFSASLFDDLQDLIAAHGMTDGMAIWDDRFFLNDPLAPVSVPDPSTPGFGGPLAAAPPPGAAVLARRFPAHDYRGAEARREARQAARAERASRLGAWPKLGSYAWVIAGGKSASGNPWVGGFPQTGFLTPTLMHYAENRSGEPGGIRGNGMEFAGGPFVLIGHTDRVAWTSTTAHLPVRDPVFEEIVNEESDVLRYNDEGTPAPLSMRTETILQSLGAASLTPVFWRSHARGGNGGSRPIREFLGDAAGTADGGSATTLTDTGAFQAGLAGGYVAVVGGTGAGQIRQIQAVPDADTLQVATAFTTPPDETSIYVAAGPGVTMVALARDSAMWLEESTTAFGFGAFQRAESLDDVRAGVRLIPSTHNFLAADNQAWNGVGTQSGSGNIGYWSSGFSRVRQDGSDARLPIDGTLPNPLVVRSGVLEAATATTLTDTGAFAGLSLSPPPVNFRYDDPSRLGSEFIVVITSGAGARQTRRIAANDDDTLTLESAFGAMPAAGDTFEIHEILAMPEAVNPAEGYVASWNNKAATRDPGERFGRNHRVAFILERLASDDLWDRVKQRQLNDNLAGLDSRGRFGRYLIPRMREAVDALGNGGNPDVDTVLAQLEAWNGAPEFGRALIDPVTATTEAGETGFLKGVLDDLAAAIFADELGPIGVPGGSTAQNLVQHAVDAAAGDVPGSRTQSYTGDYFDGADWKLVVRDALAGRAGAGIPDPSPRRVTRYDHPLSALDASLSFPTTPLGNRGTYEQIVEVGPTVRGEFIFPLGQSGHIEGSFPSGATFIDPHFLSLHDIWRDWRFVPMLSISADLAADPDGDVDGDGVLDGFERFFFGGTAQDGSADDDGDALVLVDEMLAGTDPTDADTDDDGDPDGIDPAPQDRLTVVPEPAAWLLRLAALGAVLACGTARGRRPVRTDASG